MDDLELVLAGLLAIVDQWSAELHEPRITRARAETIQAEMRGLMQLLQDFLQLAESEAR